MTSLLASKSTMPPEGLSEQKFKAATAGRYSAPSWSAGSRGYAHGLDLGELPAAVAQIQASEHVREQVQLWLHSWPDSVTACATSNAGRC